ncbi:hypothetical protein [Paracoccus sp. ME4]|uniref:hypothetical protein n=1 Tax=Paracoccus sp. ME4 TaxID=3138066 RepID=UPI00398B5010
MDLLIILCQLLLASYVLLRLRRMIVGKIRAAGKTRPPEFYDTAGRAGRHDTSSNPAARGHADAVRSRRRFGGAHHDRGAYGSDPSYSGAAHGSASSCGGGDYGGGGDSGGGGCE